MAGEGLFGAADAPPDTMTGSIASSDMPPGNPFAPPWPAAGGFGGGENCFAAGAYGALEALMNDGSPDVPAVVADALLLPWLKSIDIC